MFFRLCAITNLLAVVVVCCIAAASGDRPRPAEPRRYTVTSLGTLRGGSSIPRGLNLHGHVVGISGEVHGAFFNGFVWQRREGMKSLGQLPGGESSDAFALNREDAVVGSANNATAIRAFLWKPETGMTDLGALPGDVASKALAINDAGEVVGSSSGPRGVRAFIWTKTGGMRMLPLSPDRFVEATAINSSGQIAGVAEASGDRHAFFWCKEKGWHDLGVLSGDQSSQATALNDSGQVVGTSSGARGSHAFRWTLAAGVERLSASPHETSSGANAVNNLGNIVGFSESNGHSRAVIWVNPGTILDLNNFVPASVEVMLTSALAINDKGEIVATGIAKADLAHDDGHQHAGSGTAFLLTPVGDVRPEHVIAFRKP